MAEAAVAARRISLETFRGLDFGEQRVELIGGEIVAQAFPSTRHGVITANLAHALLSRIRERRLPCRVETGTGLEIRLERDFSLGPDLILRCGDFPGDPVLIVEVLSPSNGPAEMLEKLRAYQSLTSVVEIVYLDQSRPAARLHRRSASGWSEPAPLAGIGALLEIAPLSAAIPLAEIYRDLPDASGAG